MKLRAIYPVVSLLLILWLLVANIELRFYRSTRLALDVNQITAGLKMAEHDLGRAQECFDQKLDAAAIEWLVSAEKDLGDVDAGARGYNTALNRRFATSHGSFFELYPIAGMYAQEIRSVRQHVEYDRLLSPQDRALLEDTAADLKTLQSAIPEETLRQADKNVIRPLMQNLGELLKVQTIRAWLGV